MKPEQPLRPTRPLRLIVRDLPLLLHVTVCTVVCLVAVANFRRTSLELDALRKARVERSSLGIPKLDGLTFGELPRPSTRPVSFGRGPTDAPGQSRDSVADGAAGMAPSTFPAKTNQVRSQLPTPAPVPPTVDTLHRVVKGDTLSALARRYRTTPAAIMRANGLTGSGIRAGTTLRIPHKTP